MAIHGVRGHIAAMHAMGWNEMPAKMVVLCQLYHQPHTTHWWLLDLCVQSPQNNNSTTQNNI